MTSSEVRHILMNPGPQLRLVIQRRKGSNDNGSILPFDSKANSPPSPTAKSWTTKFPTADQSMASVSYGKPIEVRLIKGCTGLGILLDGGKNSPLGDRPLTIKRMFAAGAAEKSHRIHVGDQVTAINDVNFENHTRLEAWTYLRSLPDGEVVLTILPKL
ncbi:unnamed protein product [Soboliphyme baturini]|uniref:PDZ domain-containing protein n=1 Tax=Soboliphyme baturini TaxID=241478 RepID=A0A183IUI5_9BILA|nr:unnamed protein product [Soboliphyme baturini]